MKDAHGCPMLYKAEYLAKSSDLWLAGLVLMSGVQLTQAWPLQAPWAACNQSMQLQAHPSTLGHMQTCPMWWPFGEGTCFLWEQACVHKAHKFWDDQMHGTCAAMASAACPARPRICRFQDPGWCRPRCLAYCTSDSKLGIHRQPWSSVAVCTLNQGQSCIQLGAVSLEVQGVRNCRFWLSVPVWYMPTVHTADRHCWRSCCIHRTPDHLSFLGLCLGMQMTQDCCGCDLH